MIELRWLERAVERGGGGLDAWVRTERVLQYRQQVMMPVGGWTQGEEPQRRPEWTPWELCKMSGNKDIKLVLRVYYKADSEAVAKKL